MGLIGKVEYKSLGIQCQAFPNVSSHKITISRRNMQSFTIES